MSIRCVDGSVSMAVDYAADIRNVGNRTAVLIVIDDSSTTTTDYDTFFESVFKVFDAKKPNQSNFQVNTHPK